MTQPSKFAQPFEDYEILERVGSGGMGTVFKARRKADDMVVAIKVLRPSLSRNARYVQRLKREAEILMRLDHPGLVRGSGLGEEGGYHYLVMEFVEGRTLKALLKAWGRFPEEQVLDLGIQLAEALAYAHEQGVVHRDVKPGNILVDDEDHAKLTDLGLAKGDTDPTLTRDGATVGTPQYMSPEQAKDPAAIDERSDLYSLGATLYHMAVGLPPFEGESVVQVISKLLNERADSAGSLNPEVSTGVNLILRRLLAKDPDLRYPTARELLADLHRVKDGLAPAVDIKALARAEGRTADSGHRLARAGIAVGAIVVVLLAWLVFRPDGVDQTKPRGLDALRGAVADASKGFRYRLSLLTNYRPESDERLAVAQLRQDLLRELERELHDFRRSFDDAAIEAWLDQHGLVRARDSFESHVQTRLSARFRSYTSRSLPREVRDGYMTWLAGRGQRVEQVVAARYERIVTAAERGFEANIVPAVDRLMVKRDWAEAERILRKVLQTPGDCVPVARRARAEVPVSQSDRFASLRASIRNRLARVRAAAEAGLREYQGRINGMISRGRELLAAGFEAHARRALEGAGRVVAAQPPWVSLPSDFTFDASPLEQRVAAVMAEVRDSTRRSELAALVVCEDSIHRVLARGLDVSEAERLLEDYDFTTPEVRVRESALREDLGRLELAVDYLLDLLEVAGRKTRTTWLANERIEGRVVRVIRDHRPRVEFALAGGGRRIVRFVELDAALVAALAAGAPDRERYRIGIGLYLFMADRFEDAFVDLRNHRGSRYLEWRKRREAWLARRGADAEARARVLMQEIRTLIRERGPRFRNLEAVASEIAILHGDFAKTKIVRDARDELRGFMATIRTERRRRVLVEALPAPLRAGCDLAFAHTKDRDVVRLTLAFDRPGAFATGLSGWRRVTGGIAPPVADGASPEAELRSVLDLPLHVLDSNRPIELRFRFRVPDRQRVPDLIALDLCGSRLVMAQPPGRAGVLATVGGDPRHAVRTALKGVPNQLPAWFLLHGGGYVLEVELGAVNNVARSLRVRLNGVDITPRKRIQAAQVVARTTCAVVGDLVLERFEVVGSPLK